MMSGFDPGKVPKYEIVVNVPLGRPGGTKERLQIVTLSCQLVCGAQELSQKVKMSRRMTCAAFVPRYETVVKVISFGVLGLGKPAQSRSNLLVSLRVASFLGPMARSSPGQETKPRCLPL